MGLGRGFTGAAPRSLGGTATDAARWLRGRCCKHSGGQLGQVETAPPLMPERRRRRSTCRPAAALASTAVKDKSVACKVALPVVAAQCCQHWRPGRASAHTSSNPVQDGAPRSWRIRAPPTPWPWPVARTGGGAAAGVPPCRCDCSFSCCEQLCLLGGAAGSSLGFILIAHDDERVVARLQVPVQTPPRRARSHHPAVLLVRVLVAEVFVAEVFVAAPRARRLCERRRAVRLE